MATTDQQEMLRGRLLQAAEEDPRWLKLETLLLAAGGELIAARYWMGFSEDIDNERVLSEGQLCSPEGLVMQPGQQSRCHSNSRALASADPDQIVFSGWALSGDHIWRGHSWCVSSSTGRVTETTEPREAYFGYQA